MPVCILGEGGSSSDRLASQLHVLHLQFCGRAAGAAGAAGGTLARRHSAVASRRFDSHVDQLFSTVARKKNTTASAALVLSVTASQVKQRTRLGRWMTDVDTRKPSNPAVVITSVKALSFTYIFTHVPAMHAMHAMQRWS